MNRVWEGHWGREEMTGCGKSKRVGSGRNRGKQWKKKSKESIRVNERKPKTKI